MTKPLESSRAPNNRTVTLTIDERRIYERRLLNLSAPAERQDIIGRTINQDIFELVRWLPESFVDLLFLDPPYNLTKAFGSVTFIQRSTDEYARWLESWLPELLPTLKPTASVYICGDWRSSAAIQSVAGKHLRVRNRITWEREKGRGAKANWKNAAEDIWFCTVSDEFTFNTDAVKMKRRVRAPYRTGGVPKDWVREAEGDFRLTHPSNLWTDLTVPFWSMPENTDHPAQKPEKLLAKLIVASSHPEDVVFDPFLGSGTAAVVAKKLGRRYVGNEIDPWYACLAEKRLAMAELDCTIQGYEDGVFWERNSRPTGGLPAARSGQRGLWDALP